MMSDYVIASYNKCAQTRTFLSTDLPSIARPISIQIAYGSWLRAD